MAVWAGAILGVSLIATPVKFQAPSLTMPVGLQVGRYTFGLFSNVELAFLVATILAAAIARPRRIIVLALAAVAIQLLVERFWLLPELDGVVSQILAGAPVVFTASHWVYAVLDVSKAVLLVVASAISRSPALNHSYIAAAR